MKDKSLLRSATAIESEETVKAHAEQIVSAEEKSLVIRSDSLSGDYQAEIIPEGSFTFSPSSGFSGMASAVKITGRMKLKSSVRDSAEKKLSSHLTADSTYKREEASSSSSLNKQKKEKSGNGVAITVIILGIVAVIVLILHFFNWKIKNCNLIVIIMYFLAFYICCIDLIKMNKIYSMSFESPGHLEVACIA